MWVAEPGWEGFAARSGAAARAAGCATARAVDLLADVLGWERACRAWTGRGAPG